MEELTKPHEKDPKKVVRKGTSVVKKLSIESAKLLAQLKESANKKKFGRKVTDAEIIGRGLRLLEPNHLEELQTATYSEKDRLAMVHDQYTKENGKISLDEFIGKLLRGEISAKKS